MRYGDFLSSLSLASSHSGEFPCSVLAHGRWRSRPGQPAQAARPNIKSMRSLSMLVRIMAAYSKRGAILLRDSGRSLQVVHYVQSPNQQIAIRPRDEVIMMKYDEMMMKPMTKPMMKLGWKLLQNV